MNVVNRQRKFAVLLLLPLIFSDCSNGGGVPRPIDADGGPVAEAGSDAKEVGADLPDTAVDRHDDVGSNSQDLAAEVGEQTAGCLAKRTQEYRVVFQGTGFEAYEGKVVIGRTADSFSANRCLAAGMTRISGGSFYIELVNLTSGVYPRVQAFIDLGEDGACSADADPSWATSEAIVGRPLIENLMPVTFVVGTACGFIN